MRMDFQKAETAEAPLLPDAAQGREAPPKRSVLVCDLFFVVVVLGIPDVELWNSRCRLEHDDAEQ